MTCREEESPDNPPVASEMAELAEWENEETSGCDGGEGGREVSS